MGCNNLDTKCQKKKTEQSCKSPEGHGAAVQPRLPMCLKKKKMRSVRVKFDSVLCFLCLDVLGSCLESNLQFQLSRMC